MIPIVDPLACIRDLNGWGFRDYKIDVACGFTNGYIAQVKCGNVKEMAQKRAARLYNLWEEEAHKRGARIPPYGSPPSRETLQTQLESVTS